jgi:co-chaperonin GroES (HSP10)
MGTVYTPRNDYVVLRRSNVGTTKSGIAVPNQSNEGRQYHVVAIGPKVEGLVVGDQVIFAATPDTMILQIPNTDDLLLIRQKWLALILSEVDGQGELPKHAGRCRVCRGLVPFTTAAQFGEFVFHSGCYANLSPAAQTEAANPSATCFD